MNFATSVRRPGGVVGSLTTRRSSELKPADAGTARYRIRADRCLASRAIVARLREPFGRPAPSSEERRVGEELITRYFLDFFTGLKIGVRDKSRDRARITSRHQYDART